MYTRSSSCKNVVYFNFHRLIFAAAEIWKILAFKTQAFLGVNLYFAEKWDNCVNIECLGFITIYFSSRKSQQMFNTDRLEKMFLEFSIHFHTKQKMLLIFLPKVTWFYQIVTSHFFLLTSHCIALYP